MSIIDKLLKKKNVAYKDLNEEEKSTLRAWEASLAGRKVTDEDYRAFLDAELETAILRLCEVDLPKESEVFRKVEVRVIRKIISFLNMPLIEKTLLEKQLESQL
jgi:hypothetical protein